MTIVLPRSTIALSLLLGIVLLPQHSAAQEDCFVSFNVKSTIVTIDWIEGGGAPQVMQCVSAERMRTEIYVKNRSVFESIGSSTPSVYLDAARAEIFSLENSILSLEARISNNESLSSLQAAGEIVLYSLGKAGALIGCIAPEPGPSKLFCVVGLVESAKGTYDIITGNITTNYFSDVAARARAELAVAKIRLNELSRISQNDMGTIAENAKRMFFGYCAAIKRDCL